MFFNELDLLEIRLHELDSIVDYFILSESTKTHSGKDKPLYFSQNKQRFEPFLPKIVHQVITDTPSNYLNLYTDPNNSALKNIVIDKVNKGNWWPHNREDYGRITYESESLLLAMENCKDDDILILDEADEIPRLDVLKQVINDFNLDEIYNLRNTMYFYYLNCQKMDEGWLGSTILTFKKFKELSLCEMRMRRRGIIVENGGWHFSYLGDPNTIRYKIESHAEQSLNTSRIKDNLSDNIRNCITYNRDIYFRPTKFQITSLDNSYPKYILENKIRFKNLIRE